MKRLVWLTLAAWCTAFAQVQPVEPIVPPAADECGCDQCACGPDCQPKLCALPLPVASREAVEVATVHRPERQAAETAPAVRPSSFAPAAPSSTGVVVASQNAGPPGPLFRLHCAWLI